MKRLLLLGGAAAGLWAWLRGRRRESIAEPPPATVTPLAPPPGEPAPAPEADQAVRDAESRLDDETKYEREAESEAEERHETAERLKDDPLAEPKSPPNDAA